MKTPCDELQVKLSLRAAGALDAAEAARVEAHLEGCEACRASAAADAEVLSLAALPPVSDAERRALRELPARTLEALRRGDRRRSGGKRLLAAVAVAAAAVALVLAPAVVRKSPIVGSGPGSLPAPGRATEEAAAWEGPNLDRLWQDAGVVALESSWDGADAADAAYAALDF